MPPVAVIILNWNGEKLLRKYLPTVIEHTPAAIGEVIVADNGSSDGSIAYCREMGVCVIDLGQNYGFAEGYNRSIAQVDHPYVLLLNSDVRVTEHWLTPLYNFIDSHPDVVAVQPKLRWEKSPESFEYAGAQGGYMDRLGYPFCRGRIFATIEKDRGQYGTTPQEVFWTTGAAMLVRREAYLTAGGLDSTFFAHQEEIDLCWRWKSMGHKLFVVPSGVVYHEGGASLSAENPRKTHLNFRNNLRMLYRNLPDSRLREVLFLRFFLDMLASLVFLLSGKPKDAFAVLRAWRDFQASKPQRMDIGDREKAYKELYQHSLLVRYHIYNEKTFSSLKR
ncbi:glycosyltransferase family 2 protein [Porphyromonas sp.]|uniref:glycosyltransferase family 2 protein n=1 Tax=Porphyromonas sp. TaxID=1924944 RepID=UPI0026DCC380|nr:glycosyltransferase family 2 protein [Porphyromonas sp.]MDO4771153.1 glycosyltransferase family 2 protein [Porphyromonas sp.]